MTLTYSNEYLPSDGGLDVTHWQIFIRALRKKMGPVRYFHCGEYGDLHNRPHYHACLFGIDFSSDRKTHSVKDGITTFTSPTLTALWKKGFCLIGDVTFESAAYCARYIMKKVTGPLADDHYLDKKTGVLLKPEYTTMSRRPGLGKTWIDQYQKEVYSRDAVITRGHPSRPPKFYDSQYEIFNPEHHDQVKANRVRYAAQHAENNTPDRLFVREKVQAARLKQLTRNLDQ